MIGQKGVPATYGGIERHVEELGSRLVSRGHGVRVYCRTHYTPAGASLNGLELVRLPSVPTKHLDAITHVALSSAHALFSEADIVHYHALGPSALAWMPRVRAKRVVITVHGLDWRREKWGRVARTFLRLCEWTATRLPDATIVVSRTLEGHFTATGARRVHYVPNGTPIPPPGPTSPLEKWGIDPGGYLLFVGRLVPEKGLHVLLEAHRGAVCDWPLVVAGEGHFTDDYVESCRRIADPGVRFVGSVYGDDLAALQQHAALVVVPSSLEGLSIALLEAMSYGRPVLASDIPENRELVEGVGETFRTGDVADLGNRLRRLHGEEDRRAEMGARGRERIEAEYDWDRVVERTAEIYDRVLSGRS
jgi:glycosyltransferase involved in cell wall biosynthesis